MLLQTIKRRGFATTLHVALWVLLALIAFQLRSVPPHFRETTSHTAPARSPVPVTPLEDLFDVVPWTELVGKTNSTSPFHTRHFIPAVVTVPPPTTRKFEMTYQGFYQTSGETKQVFVKVDDALKLAKIGSSLVTNLVVTDAVFDTLTLTNSAGQTNLLKLNTKQTVEVPIQ